MIVKAAMRLHGKVSVGRVETTQAVKKGAKVT